MFDLVILAFANRFHIKISVIIQNQILSYDYRLAFIVHSGIRKNLSKFIYEPRILAAKNLKEMVSLIINNKEKDISKIVSGEIDMLQARYEIIK